MRYKILPAKRNSAVWPSHLPSFEDCVDGRVSLLRSTGKDCGSSRREAAYSGLCPQGRVSVFEFFWRDVVRADGFARFQFGGIDVEFLRCRRCAISSLTGHCSIFSRLDLSTGASLLLYYVMLCLYIMLSIFTHFMIEHFPNF